MVEGGGFTTYIEMAERVRCVAQGVVCKGVGRAVGRGRSGARCRCRGLCLAHAVLRARRYQELRRSRAS